MKIYAMLPFLGKDEVDKYLDKIISGEVTDVSIAPFLPFASKKKISEVFLAQYRSGNIRGGKISHFFPFVSEEALHEIVVDYCERGGEPIPSSIVPFLSRQDVKMLFEYQLAHPEKSDGDAKAEAAEDIAQTISDTVSNIFANTNFTDEGAAENIQEQITRTVSEVMGGLFNRPRKTSVHVYSNDDDNEDEVNMSVKMEYDDDDDELEDAREDVEDALEDAEDAIDELNDALSGLGKDKMSQETRAKLQALKRKLNEQLGNDD